MQLPEHDYKLILVLSTKVSPAVYRIAKQMSQNKKRENYFINDSIVLRWFLQDNIRICKFAVAYTWQTNCMYIASLISIIVMYICDCGNKQLGVHDFCSHYCIRVCTHESLYSSYIGYSYNTH